MAIRTKISSSSLQQKLTSYSLCAGSVLAASAAANAQVMYTDVNPDVVLENSAGTLPFDISYALDLNNDSITDFNITVQSSTSSSTNQVLYAEGISALGVNSVAAKSNIQSSLLFRFPMCDFIQQSNPGAVWSYSFQAFNFLAYSNGGGYGSVNDFYAGLLLVINGNTYYGWARFDINPDSSRSVVIKDYAYEATPYVPIRAGLCEVGIDEVKNEFTISPNPSGGKFFLTTKNILKGKTTITITDVAGKKIFTEAMLSSPSGKFSLDLSDLDAGVYFITLENEGKSMTNKLMRQ
ncbi:MAG TPA: T9SS type A sorting domain-containing protein [Chitinophagales bacterium]|nr:T9SS type A sorting domain-containing protein [Chitinophagales bacterium]